MSIETDLYSTLANDSAVAALVSARIYPNLAPENATFPMIVYSVVSGSRVDTVAGVGDMTRKQLQIDCHAEKDPNGYSTAKSVAAAVVAALEGDGYLQSEFDLYSHQDQVHTIAVTWAFLAP